MVRVMWSRDEYWQSALTPRQLEMVRLTAEGMTNEQIAARLGLSRWTVKETLIVACRKLGARSRAHCAAIAWTMGLIE